MIRKIISKEDEEKRRKRNSIIVGIILVSIMVLSTVGYGFGTNFGQNSNSATTLNYNGYDFIYSNGLWIVNVSENTFGFASNPNEVYNISSETGILTDYSGKILYLYSENSEAESEILRNLYIISSGIIYACPEGQNCGDEIPAKSCDNNFIIIREKSETNVYSDKGCRYIEGSAENLVKITDGFLMKIIGIKK
jgi:hypothetical protein